MNKLPLSAVPNGDRSRELWLNHAGGYILLRDIRDYARAQMAPVLTPEARKAALKAIDDALYGVTMVLDGVPEPLQNSTHRVWLDCRVVLGEWQDGNMVEVEQITQGEGWCMGYHSWQEGDFGDNPPFVGEDR